MSRHLSDGPISAEVNREWFETTHWSVLFRAGQTDSPLSSEARDSVCRTYWPPVYGYVRRQGLGFQEAQDLTQDFFAKLLEKNFWARAEPQKGRFRSLLLTALRQFLADQRDRAAAAKRGGGASLIPLDEPTAEGGLREVPDPSLGSEFQFDQQWASAVLEEARSRLRQECLASGKFELYSRVDFLSDQSNQALPYTELATQLGLSVSAIKSALWRLRERYGELVREEVARTVVRPSEVDEEIRYLLAVMGG